MYSLYANVGSPCSYLDKRTHKKSKAPESLPANLVHAFPNLLFLSLLILFPRELRQTFSFIGTTIEIFFNLNKY